MKKQEEKKTKKKLLLSSNELGFSVEREREIEKEEAGEKFKGQRETQRQQHELNLTVCDEGWPWTEKKRTIAHPSRTQIVNYMRMDAKPNENT